MVKKQDRIILDELILWIDTVYPRHIPSERKEDFNRIYRILDFRLKQIGDDEITLRDQLAMAIVPALLERHGISDQDAITESYRLADLAMRVRIFNTIPESDIQ